MTDLTSLVPASVTVSFPQANSSDCYTLTVTLVSLQLLEYRGITGFQGTKRFQSSTVADSTGGPPSNLTELQALAQQIATDYYLWQLARVEAVYNGTVAWPAEGHSTCIEWDHGTTDGEVVTRVHRGPLQTQNEELSQSGSGGSVVNIFSGPVTFVDVTITNGDTYITNETVNITNTTIEFNETTVVTVNNTWTWNIHEDWTINVDLGIDVTVIGGNWYFQTTNLYLESTNVYIQNVTLLQFDTITTWTVDTINQVTFTGITTWDITNVTDLNLSTTTINIGTSVVFEVNQAWVWNLHASLTVSIDSGDTWIFQGSGNVTFTGLVIPTASPALAVTGSLYVNLSTPAITIYNGTEFLVWYPVPAPDHTYSFLIVTNDLTDPHWSQTPQTHGLITGGSGPGTTGYLELRGSTSDAAFTWQAPATVSSGYTCVVPASPPDTDDVLYVSSFAGSTATLGWKPSLPAPDSTWEVLQTTTDAADPEWTQTPQLKQMVLGGSGPNVEGYLELRDASDVHYRLPAPGGNSQTLYFPSTGPSATNQFMIVGSTASGVTTLVWTDLETLLKTLTGYNASNNQALLNLGGTIQWVDLTNCP